VQEGKCVRSKSGGEQNELRLGNKLLLMLLLLGRTLLVALDSSYETESVGTLHDRAQELNTLFRSCSDPGRALQTNEHDGCCSAVRALK
jgi:hypothetical protein